MWTSCGGELAGLGFHDVVELAHGEPRAFGDGARIASYQHGFDDSALVVADGDVVIVDLNDCKLRGRALRQVVRTFGRPTFMLRTHSWAQSYPIQYEAEDPADLELITDETFLRDFADAAAALQPRYAVPFANMVAFLHPQAAANDHLITPDRVQAACAADGRLAAVEVVPLGPGDSWRAGEGFARAGGPWWADREAVLVRRADEVRPVLERTAAEEADRHLDFATFRGYLERFARDVPWPARRALGHRPIPSPPPGTRRGRGGCSTSGAGRCVDCPNRPPSGPQRSTSTRPFWRTPSRTGSSTWCTARCGSAPSCGPVG